MIIELKKRHFGLNTYFSTTKCPIARALKEQEMNNFNVWVDCITFSYRHYTMTNAYTWRQCIADRVKSLWYRITFQDKVIRVINIPNYNPKPKKEEVQLSGLTIEQVLKTLPIRPEYMYGTIPEKV